MTLITYTMFRITSAMKGIDVHAHWVHFRWYYNICAGRKICIEFAMKERSSVSLCSAVYPQPFLVGQLLHVLLWSISVKLD